MGGRFALHVTLVSLTCVGCVRFGGQPPPDAAQLADAPLTDALLMDASPDAPLPDALLTDASPDAPLPDAQLPDAQLPDAQLPDAQLPDIPSPVGCSWTGTFSLSAPVNLTTLNSTAEDANPYLTPDNKTIYFESKRAGGKGKEDIWYATRPAVGVAWSAPKAYTSLNTSLSESAFALTADGLTGFMSTDRAGGSGGLDIWSVTRASTSAIFSGAAAVPLVAVNDTEHQWDPMPAQNGLRLYISSNNFPITLGGMGSADIVVATRTSTAIAFGAPKPVPGINSVSYEANPSLSADLRLMVFTSGRAGGSGSADIWFATRAGASGAFTAPQQAPAINSASFDAEPFVSPDGCELYFISTRPGGVGGWDLYRSEYLKNP